MNQILLDLIGAIAMLIYFVAALYVGGLGFGLLDLWGVDTDRAMLLAFMLATIALMIGFLMVGRT